MSHCGISVSQSDLVYTYCFSPYTALVVDLGNDIATSLKLLFSQLVEVIFVFTIKTIQPFIYNSNRMFHLNMRSATSAGSSLNNMCLLWVRDYKKVNLLGFLVFFFSPIAII